jgi:hypothetical protein
MITHKREQEPISISQAEFDAWVQEKHVWFDLFKAILTGLAKRPHHDTPLSLVEQAANLADDAIDQITLTIHMEKCAMRDDAEAAEDAHNV